MGTWKRGLAAISAAGLMVLGGLGASSAQQQQPPRLDVDKLVADLGLSDEARRAIAPELEKLDALLARRAQLRQQGAEVRGQMTEIFSKVLPQLTVEQRQRLHQALWATGAMGPAGYEGGAMMGPMGRGFMGPGMGAFGHGPGCRGWGAGAGRTGGFGGPGARMHRGAFPGWPPLGPGY